MKLWWIGLGGLLALGVVGCQEDLASPAQCPDLCPGNRVSIRDTVFEAVVGSDSAYFGYTLRSSRQVLLVSDSLPAGEYRSFVVFGKSSRDSVTVDGNSVKFVTDTMAISFQVEGRDTTAKNLRLLLYRIPITTDTAIGFDSLEALLSPANLVDSAAMSDTLKFGRVETLIAGDRLASLLPSPEDSGRFGVGLRVRADRPTGVRVSLDPQRLGTGPLLEFRGEALAVVDTSKRRQKVQARFQDVANAGFVQTRNLGTNPNPDLLYIGGPSAARSIVRFNIPLFIRDSTQLLRATLELTPAVGLFGLPNSRDPDRVGVVGVVTDLGAKSPTSTIGGIPQGALAEGTTTPTSIDVINVVASWSTARGTPQAVFLQHSQETLGGGFMQPAFFSTRSATGRPTLRITYSIPSKPGQP